MAKKSCDQPKYPMLVFGMTLWFGFALATAAVVIFKPEARPKPRVFLAELPADQLTDRRSFVGIGPLERAAPASLGDFGR